MRRLLPWILVCLTVSIVLTGMACRDDVVDGIRQPTRAAMDHNRRVRKLIRDLGDLRAAVVRAEGDVETTGRTPDVPAFPSPGIELEDYYGECGALPSAAQANSCKALRSEVVRVHILLDLGVRQYQEYAREAGDAGARTPASVESDARRGLIIEILDEAITAIGGVDGHGGAMGMAQEAIVTGVPGAPAK